MSLWVDGLNATSGIPDFFGLKFRKLYKVSGSLFAVQGGFVGRLTLRADVFHQEVDGLEAAVAFFYTVIVKPLGFLVPLGHDFGGVQEMLDADGKLVRFAAQVVEV